MVARSHEMVFSENPMVMVALNQLIGILVINFISY
jgi:hypothetical protein